MCCIIVYMSRIVVFVTIFQWGIAAGKGSEHIKVIKRTMGSPYFDGMTTDDVCVFALMYAIYNL